MTAAQQKPVKLGCKCGQTQIEITGEPIMSVVCACHSCRTAGQAMERASGAPPVLRQDGGTDYSLYRKDRFRVRPGAPLLEHRLTPESKTRRIVARCCNTPMFLDFTPGHWVTIYRDRLPLPRPALELRTMGKDTPPGVYYDDEIATYPTHSFKFFGRLLWAWAGMGFRRPKLSW